MSWIYGNDSDFLLPGLGGGFIFFIFAPNWGDDPIWLIFFRWVETTNQTFKITVFSIIILTPLGQEDEPEFAAGLKRDCRITQVRFLGSGMLRGNFSKDDKFASTYPSILTAISIITPTICFMTPQKRNKWHAVVRGVNNHSGSSSRNHPPQENQGIKRWASNHDPPMHMALENHPFQDTWFRIHMNT